LRWIEADYPHIVELKSRELQNERPRCRLERVAVDLADPAARDRVLDQAAHGARQVAVLTEGVIPYLTNAQAEALARGLRARQPIRHWILEYQAPQVVRYLLSDRRKKEMGGAPFQFDPGDWFAFFARTGWVKKEVRYLGETSRELGRHSPFPWWVHVLHCITPGPRRRALDRFSGYALMEPGPQA
jgi:O-methyltransferase involved in polyketide biosynthesis